MKRELLKVCLLLSMIFMSVDIYAAQDCDCYMEYEDIETEAKVYADQESKDASVTEFSLEEKVQIQEATIVMADL